MTQFTANEVLRKLRERFTSGNSVPVPDVRLTRAEFDAFADLLEAREKAVPVAYALFTEKGLIRMWSREWFADAHGAPVNPTPLYVHPTPADTERLAEALRNLVSEWVAIADDGDATLEDSTIGYRACANRLSAMLAAHSAQAQPPAASVTDEMVERARSAFVQADDGSTGITDAIRAALLAAHSAHTPWTEGEKAHFKAAAELVARREAAQAQPPAASVTDATYAARYRWLRDMRNREQAAMLVSFKMNLDAAIDAAMAKESGR